MKPCAHPGCPRLLPRSERYCMAHSNRKRVAAKQKQHHAMYGRKWNEASRAFLAQGDNAWCRNCGAIAQCVDHITPHDGDTALFWDSENWQPLCNQCHSRKTVTEDGGFGNKRKAKGE